MIFLYIFLMFAHTHTHNYVSVHSGVYSKPNGDENGNDQY